MKCPYCESIHTKVVDSRLNQTQDITRRRRACETCSGRFTTYERVEEVMPVVTKKDGRREAYLRDKIYGGIQKACQKRKITTEQMDAVVNEIEKRIQSIGLKEIPSRTIGQMVMAALHRLDKVAYVRFASVYREFRDLEEFVAELQEGPLSSEETGSLLFPFATDPEGVSPTSQTKDNT